MASKCIINALHAWLNKRGIFKMIFKGQTIFEDNDYHNLNANVSISFTPPSGLIYTELGSCSTAGATAPYNTLTYNKIVNGGAPQTFTDGYLHHSNAAFTTVTRQATGSDQYTGTMTIAQNTTGLARHATIYMTGNNAEGAMGQFTVTQTGDAQGRLLLFTKSWKEVPVTASANAYQVSLNATDNELYIFANQPEDYGDLKISATSGLTANFVRTLNDTPNGNYGASDLQAVIAESAGYSASSGSDWTEEFGSPKTAYKVGTSTGDLQVKRGQLLLIKTTGMVNITVDKWQDAPAPVDAKMTVTASSRSRSAISIPSVGMQATSLTMALPSTGNLTEDYAYASFTVDSACTLRVTASHGGNVKCYLKTGGASNVYATATDSPTGYTLSATVGTTYTVGIIANEDGSIGTGMITVSTT